jgi:hypothetical protein
MTKLFLLMIFFFMGSYSLKAGETLGDDQEFKSELDNIKSPFEEVISKPMIIINNPVHHEEPKPIVFPRTKPKPKPVVPLKVLLPALNLQGVIVGEGIHQAIINDKVVPLHGTIGGARVDSVTKQGVELFFKGKKFFLKVD